MKKYIIYTDGSHLKRTTGRLGIGGIITEGAFKKIDSFSEELSVDYLRKNYGTSDVSNPTCEMLAALESIKIFSKYIKPGDEVVIKSDYSGVQNFILGKWKIKAPYIQKIKNEIDKELDSRGIRNQVDFEWVKGHQNKSVLDPDAFWNNQVDLLAKGQEDDE